MTESAPPMMKHASIFGLLAALTVTLVNSSKALSQEGGEKKSGQKDFPLAVLLEIKPRLLAYLEVRQAQTMELASKYGKVIDAQLNKAADAGDLKTAAAFQGEKDNLNELGKGFPDELKDPVAAVMKAATLPELNASTPGSLVTLRKIWTTELQKIRIKADGDLQQSLKTLEVNFTKARDFKNAKVVLIFRESLPSNTSVAVIDDADSKRAPAIEEPTKESKSAKKRDLEKKLVGTKWKDRGGFIYQFEKGGKALYTAPGQPTQTWQWKVEEPGKVRFLYSSLHSIVFIYGEGERVKKEWWEGDKLLGTMEVEEIR